MIYAPAPLPLALTISGHACALVSIEPRDGDRVWVCYQDGAYDLCVERMMTIGELERLEMSRL